MKNKKPGSRDGCITGAGYKLLSDLADLDRIITDLDPEEADKRQEELIARLDAIALKNPKQATAIFLKSPFFVEDIEDGEYYLSYCDRITRAQLAELNTPEKRAAYIAEQDRAFDEAYKAGKHIIIGGGGFTVLED